VLVVPEDRRLDEVLAEFQERGTQMAVVIDEWGAFEGIVTIEDILEEIVGEITDQFEAEEQEPSIEQLDEDVYAIDGKIPLQRTNERLGTRFENEEFDTVGGLVLSHLGHAPEVGDRVELDGHALQVEAVRGNRITRVTVRASTTSTRTGARGVGRVAGHRPPRQPRSVRPEITYVGARSLDPSSMERSQEAQAEDYEIENRHATITEIEVLDENREEEVQAVMEAELEGLQRRLDDLEEEHSEMDPNSDVWDRVAAHLDALPEDEETNDKVTKLEQRIERPYPSLVAIRFEVEGGFEFVPGQYARITFRDNEPRVYSIASSPNRDYAELCVRRVPGGELTPVLCEEAAEGDDLFVRGPYGDELRLNEPSERDLVFVATGTGVAPLRSMIEYAFEEGYDECEGDPRDVWLFLGSSWRDHLPYHSAFEDLAGEHENFHYVPTLSREALLTDWTGETDYVQRVLLKYVDEARVETGDLPEGLADFVGAEPASDVDARFDPASMEVYVCGIGAMCSRVKRVVRNFDLPDRCYEEESYG
jgi:CDP-4-dehydro-6-deoxyglucose reductase